MGGVAHLRTERRTEPSSVSGLRLGVLHSERPASGWQIACLNRLLALPGAELVLAIEDDTSPASWSGGGGVISRLFWHYVRRRSRALAPAPWPPGMRDARVTRMRAYSGTIDRGQVNAVRDLALDLLLDFSAGCCGVALAGYPRRGVWSLRFDAPAEGQASPPCFWALVRGEPTVQARLVMRLPGEASRTLYEGHLKAFQMSYVRTCDYLLFRAASWPAEQAARAWNALDGPSEAASVAAAGSSRAPSDWHVARLLWRSLRASVVAAFDTLFRAEQWHIGVIDSPIGALLNGGSRPQVRWLPRLPAGWYVADPYGIPGRDIVLAEAFHYGDAKGYITALDVTSPRLPIPLPSLFVDTVHLSYPYLIEDQGQLYCLPERSAANNLILYRITSYPDQWEAAATLISGFPAVDATVIQHEGVWWLFATMSERGYESTLHLWYASALRGPWTPHPGNPVKTDVRSSRPAGTPFLYNGELYRPAQDCSRVYGGAVKLLRVTELNIDRFAEEVVATVGPWRDTAYPVGLHTLTKWGDRTLVDAKRLHFAPAALRQVVRYYGRVVKNRILSAAR